MRLLYSKRYMQGSRILLVSFTKGLRPEPLLDILTDDVAAFRFLDTEDTLPDNFGNSRLEEI